MFGIRSIKKVYFKKNNLTITIGITCFKVEIMFEKFYVKIKYARQQDS